MTVDCLFCKIAAGQIPATIVHQDDKVIAINDINPAAPVHVLIIPREHIASLADVNDKHSELLAHIQLTASKLAKELQISEQGYRLVNNCGIWGGQTVSHLHFHLLGGREFGWPPG